MMRGSLADFQGLETRSFSRDKFRGYKDIISHDIREHKVRKSTGCMVLIEEMKKWFGWHNHPENPETDNEFQRFYHEKKYRLEKRLEELEYTPGDIALLSYELARYPDMMEKTDSIFSAGKFLNLVIEHCDDSRFMIYTEDSDWPVNGFGGFFFGKDIVVVGNIGLIDGFSGGSLVIKGNAGPITLYSGDIIIEGNVRHRIRGGNSGSVTVMGDFEKQYSRGQLGNSNNGTKIIIGGNSFVWQIGNQATRGLIHIKKDCPDGEIGWELSGAEIIVDGNAGGIIGKRMSGGKIVINGDTSRPVGPGMTGGEIHVNGRWAGIDHALSGKIFHKGKVVFER